MTILVIDTSSEYLSLAILQCKNKFIFHEKVGNTQSLRILPELEQLLNQHSLELEIVDHIVYNQGPGSFTGLRIGLSVALGLAYAKNLPLIPIPAFFAYSNKKTAHKENLMVLIDARLNQVYFAVISQLTRKYLIKPQLINPQDIVHLITPHSTISPHNSLVTGTGFTPYLDIIDAKLVTEYTYIVQDQPSALDLSAHYRFFSTQNCFNADLLYLRNKVALSLNEQQYANSTTSP